MTGSGDGTAQDERSESRIEAHDPTTLEVTVGDAGVAEIVLNGPHVLNALHSSTHELLRRAVADLERDDRVGAVVLRSAGRAFCAGSDLREVGQLQGEAAQQYVQLDFATKNAVATCRVPVIAAIQGYCVGGGAELALACDLRIASTDAVFAFPEVPLGSLPGSGGLQRLPAVVGVGVARDWILTGRQVGASEAYDRGLVTHLVEPDDLVEVARDLARSIATHSRTALWLAKVALDPSPIAETGLVAAFQMLSGDACHREPGYSRATSRFTAKGQP
jgi:enoyl-CoA hydratase/carnithine racemase